MKILAGSSIVNAESIFSEKFYYEGANRPCLKINLSKNGITKKQLADLLENSITLQDDDGVELGIHPDYDTMTELSLTLVQIKPLEMKVAELENQLIEQKRILEEKAEKEKEQLRIQLADLQVKSSSEVEKALAEERQQTSRKIQGIKLENTAKINEAVSSYELELEETIVSYRDILKEKMENPLEKSLDEKIQEEVGNLVLDWRKKKRYLTGERVTGDYIALKFNRGKPPEEYLGTYWGRIKEKLPDNWEEIEDYTVIEPYMIVKYNDQLWSSTVKHLKSNSFKPEENSLKWEKVE